MIQNDVLPAPTSDSITAPVGSYPDIPNYDIIGVNAEIPLDRDAISRCGLSSKGDVVLPDSHISIDCSRHLEDDNSWSLGITSRLKAARTRVFEMSHGNDLATALRGSASRIPRHLEKQGGRRARGHRWRWN